METASSYRPQTDQQPGSQSQGNFGSRTQGQDMVDALNGQTGTYIATVGNCAFLVTVQNGTIRNCLSVSGGQNPWHLRQISSTPIEVTSQEVGNPSSRRGTSSLVQQGDQPTGSQSTYDDPTQTARGATNSS